MADAEFDFDVAETNVSGNWLDDDTGHDQDGTYELRVTHHHMVRVALGAR